MNTNIVRMTYRKIGTRALLAAALGLGLAACSTSLSAQDGTPPPAAPQDSPNAAPNTAPPPSPNGNQPPAARDGMRSHRGDMSAMTDAQFAKEAAGGGMAEVKLGQLAQEKGTSDAVKAFGKRMMADHTQAGENLKAAAAKSNIELPTDMGPRDQATYDRLSKLSGTDFDQAYARDMVRDHMHDVAAFRHESTNGTDPNIKQFATATLPTLQEHLKQARDMAQSLGVTMGPGPGGQRGPRPGASSDQNPNGPPPPASPQQ